MKIRNGFVSNSSSSSFVVKAGGKFQTALDLAEHMIPFRQWDDDQDLLNKIQKIKQSRGDNIPPTVCFNSCNYDTFIAKMGDVFLVETCHNHDWDLGQYSAPCPPEYYEYFGDDAFYDLSRVLEFLHLEYDVKGKRCEWGDIPKTHDSFCECHSHDFWKIDGKILCPKCKQPPQPRKK